MKENSIKTIKLRSFCHYTKEKSKKSKPADIDAIFSSSSRIYSGSS